MTSLNNVSVVLPTKDFLESTKRVLNSLSTQSVIPDEVVVIDSSIEDEIQSLISKFNKNLKIKYLRVDGLFPGEARNLGAKNASNEILAFLDSKTVPSKYWIEDALKKLHHTDLHVIFGSTKYEAKSYFQTILQACVFGRKPVETTPGSLIYKNKFFESGGFIEGVRASDDLNWRKIIKDLNFKSSIADKSNLTYNQISLTLQSELKRQFIYQFYSALTEVQLNTKIFIFGVVVLLISLIIPHWNAVVGNESSIFYIPYITRGFFYLFSLFSLIILTSSKFIKFKNILTKIIAAIFIIYVFFIVNQWNAVIADWADDSFLYIPHITKGYVISITVFCFLFRGVYKPINGGFQFSELFPFHWISFGIVGLILDIAKLPGYFFGAILALVRIFK